LRYPLRRLETAQALARLTTHEASL